MTVSPTTIGMPWHAHVRDWWDRPGVGHVTFEGLLADPVEEMVRALRPPPASSPTGTWSSWRCSRHDFSTVSRPQVRAGGPRCLPPQGRGRATGATTSPARRARSSTPTPANELVDFGYATDRTWFEGL